MEDLSSSASTDFEVGTRPAATERAKAIPRGAKRSFIKFTGSLIGVNITEFSKLVLEEYFAIYEVQ